MNNDDTSTSNGGGPGRSSTLKQSSHGSTARSGGANEGTPGDNNSQITVWRRAEIVSLEFSWMFSKQVRPQKEKQNISSTIVFYLFIFQLKFCNNVINDSLQTNPDSAADQAGADELDDGAEGSSVDKQVVLSKQRRGSTHNSLPRTHNDRLGTDLKIPIYYKLCNFLFSKYQDLSQLNTNVTGAFYTQR